MLFEFFYEPPETTVLDPDPPVAPFNGAKVEIATPTMQGVGTIMQMEDVEGSNLKRLVIHTYDEKLQAELGEDAAVKVLKQETNGDSPTN